MLIKKVKFWVKYAAGSSVLPVPNISSNDRTFFLWEPCLTSHDEVLPGYAKYLLDLGYEVCVLADPNPLNKSLFERFTHSRLKIIFLSQRQIVRFFLRNGLGRARGILITTARKLGEQNSYLTEYKLFSNRSSCQKVLLVEHDVKLPIEKGFIRADTITIGKTDYQDIPTVVVNPHYFGEICTLSKPKEIVQFIAVGIMKDGRYNMARLIEAVQKLHKEEIFNFQVVVIGKKSIRDYLPEHIQDFFVFLEQVPFGKLYEQLDKAHYLVTLFDDLDESHLRYITTGSSGSMQLVYGFRKPCIIARKFANHYDLDDSNSIIYSESKNLHHALKTAIHLDVEAYCAIQDKLAITASKIYRQSLDNLRNLIGDCPN